MFSRSNLRTFDNSFNASPAKRKRSNPQPACTPLNGRRASGYGADNPKMCGAEVPQEPRRRISA
jgi:hypothetical protein